MPSSSVDSSFRLRPQCSTATLLCSILFYFFKVVYCRSWNFQVFGGHLIQRILSAVCGGRRKDRHGTACSFLPPHCGNMETYSVNCMLARQLNVRDRQHCTFVFSWAVGTKADAFCHIDVLVCGPTSVSGKAEGENF